MMQYVRRCSFICGAVLSLLLLLCSCQIGVGTGQFVQPPDNSPDDSSQGKTQLLSALNQEYFHRVQISNHFIQGSDSAAETVFLYLEQNSGGDINKAVELLAENPEDEYCRANCADAVLSRISPSSSETYWVSYSFLSADILEDGVLKEDAEFGPVPESSSTIGIFWFRRILISLTTARDPALPSASSAVRRSSWQCSFPDNIFQDKQK